MVTLGRTNPKVAQLRKLMRSGSARREAGLFVVEGPKAAREVVERGYAVSWGLCAESSDTDVENLEAAGIPIYWVSDTLLQQLSDTRAPQGLLLVVGLPAPPTVEDLVSAGRDLFLLSHVQDPGNVGALVRVAAAAGFGGVVTDSASADPFGPRAVRASAASVLKTPILRADLTDVATRCSAQGIQVVAAVARGGEDPFTADLTPPAAFLLGGEGGGLSQELTELAGVRVSIPMDAEVESLNVAVAGALLAFEARRQRER